MYDFNAYVRLLTEFAQEDLSAFYFDIRKDSLYCDAVNDPKRRACRTVFDTLFHALVRYAAPVLCFTAEEIWQARFPSEDGSVHLLEWPEVEVEWLYPDSDEIWRVVRRYRADVSNAIEPLRREKIVRSSLEASVKIPRPYPFQLEWLESIDLAEIFIVADVTWNDDPNEQVSVTRSDFHKCGRCWRLLPDVAEDGALCDRCEKVVA